MLLHRLSLALMLALASTCTHADVLWNEPSQGDLSDDRFHPTPFTVSPGSNELIGFLAGGNTGPIDRDYYSITIPEGMQLAQLNLLEYFSIDQVAFIGIQPGPIFPNDPATVQPGDLFGWLHFGPEYLGMDILPIMGSRGIGFTPPLPSGTYSFWAQQTDDPTDYLMDFVVTVPSPGVLGLPIAASIATLRRRSRST